MSTSRVVPVLRSLARRPAYSRPLSLALRRSSTFNTTPSTPTPTPTPTPLSSLASSSTPQYLPYRQSGWRSFLQILGRVTLVTLVGGAGTFYYITQKDRTPGAQLPFDPEKKTVVVLGSGWAATSLLKTIDTEDYNVVRIAS